MEWMAAAAIAGPIIGGIIGNAAASGDREAARQAAAQAAAQLTSMGLPPDLSKQLILKEFQKAGTLTPEMEHEVNSGISQVSQIQEDPSLRNAQVAALNMFQQRSKGLAPEDRAQLNGIRNQIASQEEAKRQQILQSFQQRGMGGSGAELAAQLAGAQSGANEASAQGDRLSAMASQNALQAMAQSGQLGGQIRGQDFDVNRTKASAADQFKQFDVQNQIARQARNVASANQAQAGNIQNTQNVSNANVQQANAETERANQAHQDYWNSLLQRNTAAANALNGQASNLQQQAGQTAGMWQGIGSGVGAGAGAYLNYSNKKPEQKQNVNAFDWDAEKDKYKGTV